MGEVTFPKLTLRKVSGMDEDHGRKPSEGYINKKQPRTKKPGL